MTPDGSGRIIRAPIGAGELIDKITILEIKAERVGDPRKARNVATELKLLHEIRAEAGLDGEAIERFAEELRAVNTALWEIEDALRACEARGDFGPDFVALARSVYQTNDRRSALKKRIDLALGSAIVEEKSYDHI